MHVHAQRSGARSGPVYLRLPMHQGEFTFPLAPFSTLLVVVPVRMFGNAVADRETTDGLVVAACRRSDLYEDGDVDVDHRRAHGEHRVSPHCSKRFVLGAFK